jgi:DNA-binding transcriptional LysR family regulator
MELQQLRGFYYSAKLGSLTKAAEKMSITQSAVSQQIKALEDELSVKLFNRFGPRKDLTQDGKLFLNLITTIIQEIDGLKTTFEDRKGNQKGLLTIAATTFIIMNYLPTVINKFIKTHPNVRLTILERRWSEIVNLAQSGEIDFGITPVTQIPNNLKCFKLEPIDRVLIACEGHPLAQKKQVTLLDIAQYPMITYEKGLISRDDLDRVFNGVQLDIDVLMEATNAETIKRYVELGIGIAVIPKGALTPTQSKKMEVIPVSKYFGQSQYGVLLRKGKYLTSWTKNFILFLSPSLKKYFLSDNQTEEVNDSQKEMQ